MSETPMKSLASEAKSSDKTDDASTSSVIVSKINLSNIETGKKSTEKPRVGSLQRETPMNKIIKPDDKTLKDSEGSSQVGSRPSSLRHSISDSVIPQDMVVCGAESNIGIQAPSSTSQPIDPVLQNSSQSSLIVDSEIINLDIMPPKRKKAPIVNDTLPSQSIIVNTMLTEDYIGSLSPEPNFDNIQNEAHKNNNSEPVADRTSPKLVQSSEKETEIDHEPTMDDSLIKTFDTQAIDGLENITQDLENQEKRHDNCFEIECKNTQDLLEELDSIEAGELSPKNIKMALVDRVSNDKSGRTLTEPQRQNLPPSINQQKIVTIEDNTSSYNEAASMNLENVGESIIGESIQRKGLSTSTHVTSTKLPNANNDSDNMAMFKTASGKALRVKKEGLERAAKMFEGIGDDLGLFDPKSDSIFQPASGKGKSKSSEKVKRTVGLFDDIIDSSEFSNTGGFSAFQTAGGKVLKVSSEAMERATKLFEGLENNGLLIDSKQSVEEGLESSNVRSFTSGKGSSLAIPTDNNTIGVKRKQGYFSSKAYKSPLSLTTVNEQGLTKQNQMNEKDDPLERLLEESIKKAKVLDRTFVSPLRNNKHLGDDSHKSPANTFQNSPMRTPIKKALQHKTPSVAKHQNNTNTGPRKFKSPFYNKGSKASKKAAVSKTATTSVLKTPTKSPEVPLGDMKDEDAKVLLKSFGGFNTAKQPAVVENTVHVNDVSKSPLVSSTRDFSPTQYVSKSDLGLPSLSTNSNDENIPENNYYTEGANIDTCTKPPNRLSVAQSKTENDEIPKNKENVVCGKRRQLEESHSPKSDSQELYFHKKHKHDSTDIAIEKERDVILHDQLQETDASDQELTTKPSHESDLSDMPKYHSILHGVQKPTVHTSNNVRRPPSTPIASLKSRSKGKRQFTTPFKTPSTTPGVQRERIFPSPSSFSSLQSPRVNRPTSSLFPSTPIPKQPRRLGTPTPPLGGSQPQSPMESNTTPMGCRLRNSSRVKRQLFHIPSMTPPPLSTRSPSPTTPTYSINAPDKSNTPLTLFTHKSVFDLRNPEKRKSLRDLYNQIQIKGTSNYIPLSNDITELSPTNSRDYLFADSSGNWGVSEARSDLLKRGCLEHVATEEWVGNHYRWVLWQMARLVRRFPSMQKDIWNKETVLDRLLYRYEREYTQGERSVIKTICEKDGHPSNPMVLLIANIMEPKNASGVYQIELTDGWYGITGQCDIRMDRAIQESRLCVGDKIIACGAKILGLQEGIPPLEISPAVTLKLSSNSCRRAPWYEKLGLKPANFKLYTSISSLKENGGQVCGILDVVVIRRYPLCYMETMDSGSKVIRSKKEEEKREVEYQEAKQQRLQSMLQKKSNENDRPANNSKRRGLGNKSISGADGELLYGQLQNEVDQVGFLSGLSSDNHRVLQEYMEDRNEAMNKEVMEEITQSHPPRKVTPLFKLRVCDYPSHKYTDPARKHFHAIITVWGGGPELHSQLEEGKRYHMTNLNASLRRPREAWGGYQTTWLSTHRTLTFQPVPAEQDTIEQSCYVKRQVLSPSALPEIVMQSGHEISIRGTYYSSKPSEALPIASTEVILTDDDDDCEARGRGSRCTTKAAVLFPTALFGTFSSERLSHSGMQVFNVRFKNYDSTTETFVFTADEITEYRIH
ncbi:hypothetical protein H4219_002910 [Mycoemilia scoparia]|uniref:Tower domain-containing protein n=1 Tax=Mycoemilia scoparia TaxID=417184 RepID=A0A9W7ZWB4_9FUNG|nr:hypothetical protein H4219_002910 [Mycoemilia scoparia]